MEIEPIGFADKFLRAFLSRLHPSRNTVKFQDAGGSRQALYLRSQAPLLLPEGVQNPVRCIDDRVRAQMTQIEREQWMVKIPGKPEPVQVIGGESIHCRIRIPVAGQPLETADDGLGREGQCMSGDKQIAEDEVIPVQNGGADAGKLEAGQGQVVRILRVAKDVSEVELPVEDLGPVPD